MGLSHSNELSPEEMSQLQQQSNFTPEEILKLYKRFQTIDKDYSGTLSNAELMRIPEFAMNPLSQRIANVLTQMYGHDGEVSFDGFLKCMSIFRPDAPIREKLKFAFKVYDLNNNNLITEKEIRQILFWMVGDHLSNEELNDLIQQTMERIKSHSQENDSLSFDVFCDILENSCSKEEIKEKLSLLFI